MYYWIYCIPVNGIWVIKKSVETVLIKLVLLVYSESPKYLIVGFCQQKAKLERN